MFMRLTVGLWGDLGGSMGEESVFNRVVLANRAL